MINHYILKDGEPVATDDVIEWSRWYEDANRGRKRHVGDETIDGARVSTVFLALDHAFGAGPPILWETMVFGGPLDQEYDRCSGSREQALAMHARMVQRVKEAKEAA